MMIQRVSWPAFMASPLEMILYSTIVLTLLMTLEHQNERIWTVHKTWMLAATVTIEAIFIMMFKLSFIPILR